jgi:VIT1/CCC1 family predicted Fe2+/Mn2+ transporter
VGRPTRHVEPRGVLHTARHYIRELIYGSNDGIITTFAVVAGVSGGGLPLHVILICGAANLFADGLSMAVGNYLSIRSHESVLETLGLPEEEAYPARHGAVTFAAFVAAGSLPLIPYLAPGLDGPRFAWSIAVTFTVLFGIGALRSLIANVTWWRAGLEMLALGVLVAAAAYGSGSLVAELINPSTGFRAVD